MINFISLFTFFVIILESVSNARLCNRQESVELNWNLTYNGLVFKANETILDIHHGRETVRGCMDLKGNWTRKCCPIGEAYHINARRCVSHFSREMFNPPVMTQNNTPLKGFNANEKLNFKFDKVVCAKDKGERRLPISPSARSFHLIENGHLYVEIPEHNTPVLIYKPDKYCIDIFVSKTVRPHLNGLVCFHSNQKYTNLELSSSCRLVSCFYIMLTVVLYACLPELRNLSGLALMTFLLCFSMSFLFISTKQILIMEKMITQELCTILSFITYFYQLSTKFWLNIMCYDIWWTFSFKRTRPWSGTQHIRFLLYALYAFGLPTAMTALLAALGYSDIPIKHRLLPDIKSQACFMNAQMILLYVYGPTLLLFIADIILLVLTSFKIRQIKRETMVTYDKESPLNDQDAEDIRRFVLYVKLFGVKCTYWALDVFTPLFPEGDFVWQFFDAFNLIVGFAIFILVAWKKNNWKFIKKRYKQLKGVPMSQLHSCSTISQIVALEELQMNSYNKLCNY